MSDSDTRPGSLDGEGHRYHRRMTEQRLDNIANSSILKLLQYVITGVMVPFFIWLSGALLDRLTKVEEAIQKNNTTTATNELRMSNLERAQADRDAQVKVLQEKAIIMDMELRSLKQMPGPRR